jgi:hypothetical protein
MPLTFLVQVRHAQWLPVPAGGKIQLAAAPVYHLPRQGVHVPLARARGDGQGVEERWKSQLNRGSGEGFKTLLRFAAKRTSRAELESRAANADEPKRE